MGVDINKYFEKTNQTLNPQKLTPVTIGDTEFTTYKVKPILTDKINFKKADMFEVMKNHKDESNTIVLCRNVLGYYDENKIDEFLELLSKKLKPKQNTSVNYNQIFKIRQPKRVSRF